jgi:hypothetical protein
MLSVYENVETPESSTYEWICLFVCLFIVARAIFQLSGGCHHYRLQGCKFWPMLGAQGLWAGRDLYRATPTATRDLGLYGLIRKTGTYIPQWDSNPQRKDHQNGIDHFNRQNVVNISKCKNEGQIKYMDTGNKALFSVERGWKPTRTRTQNREKHYFGLNVL